MEPSEESAVRRARQGEAGAFEELYRRHVGRIFALCMRLSGDPARAEELTQEAFVRAFERFGQFRGDSGFGSWLHRLAVNVALGARRSSRRFEARVVSLGGPGELDVHAGPAAPASTAVPAEAGIDLERAIRTLPEGARFVFVLHDVEGFGHQEIADMTGLAVGTSKSQLHRARRLLRKVLGR